MFRIPPPINNVSWPLLSSYNISNSTESEADTQMAHLNSSAIKFLKINRTSEVVDEPFHDRVDFWRKLNLLPFKKMITAPAEVCSNDTSNSNPCSSDDDENKLDGTFKEDSNSS